MVSLSHNTLILCMLLNQNPYKHPFYSLLPCMYTEIFLIWNTSSKQKICHDYNNHTQHQLCVRWTIIICIFMHNFIEMKINSNHSIVDKIHFCIQYITKVLCIYNIYYGVDIHIYINPYKITLNASLTTQ